MPLASVVSPPAVAVRCSPRRHARKTAEAAPAVAVQPEQEQPSQPSEQPQPSEPQQPQQPPPRLRRKRSLVVKPRAPASPPPPPPEAASSPRKRTRRAVEARADARPARPRRACTEPQAEEEAEPLATPVKTARPAEAPALPSPTTEACSQPTVGQSPATIPRRRARRTLSDVPSTPRSAPDDTPSITLAARAAFGFDEPDGVIPQDAASTSPVAPAPALRAARKRSAPESMSPATRKKLRRSQPPPANADVKRKLDLAESSPMPVKSSPHGLSPGQKAKQAQAASLFSFDGSSPRKHPRSDDSDGGAAAKRQTKKRKIVFARTPLRSAAFLS